jgi:hypothetical protein
VTPVPPSDIAITRQLDQQTARLEPIQGR